MQHKKITIAIDGYSSCGKSTLAKDVAKELGYVFIDSGAMYRAVTYFALQNGIIKSDSINVQKLISALPSINLHFAVNPTTLLPEIYLNNQNIETEIRRPEIASHVSRIAEIKEVRVKLVDEQQKMGQGGGIVMDGRDIGSVVFPNAGLKLFVTASIEVRTQRRYDELIQKGIATTRQEVQENLQSRDLIDTTREESPLIQTHDAIVLDNTFLSKDEQLDHVLALINQLNSKDKSEI